MKVSKIQELIKAELKAGVNKDEIIVNLFTNHSLSLGQATKQFAKYLKDNNLQIVRVGFNSDYNDWLIDNQPSVEDAKLYINENGSDNIKRHEKHYLKLRDLAERAFEKGKAGKK